MKKPFSNNKAVMTLYSDLLAGIKIRIRQGQNRAVMSANAEMLCLYWDIGRMITVRQDAEGWGAAVIPRLAIDLRNELPEINRAEHAADDSVLQRISGPFLKLAATSGQIG